MVSVNKTRFALLIGVAAVVLTAAVLLSSIKTTFPANAAEGYEYTSKFSWESFENGDFTLPYRLYVPEEGGGNKQYPLLLFLHGSGGRGDDNRIPLTESVAYHLFNGGIIEDRQAIVVVPQCPETSQWVLTPWVKGSYSTEDIPESTPLAATFALVEMLCKKYAVDTERVYVTGLSMGGYGTWDIITRHPGVFAAAVPICGAGDPLKADLIADSGISIWAFHGTNDRVVPFSGSSDMEKALIEAGGDITLTAFKDGGHDAWNPAYSKKELFDWMFAQSLDNNPIEQTKASEENTYGTETTTSDSGSDAQSGGSGAQSGGSDAQSGGSNAQKGGSGAQSGSNAQKGGSGAQSGGSDAQDSGSNTQKGGSGENNPLIFEDALNSDKNGKPDSNAAAVIAAAAVVVLSAVFIFSALSPKRRGK